MFYTLSLKELPKITEFYTVVRNTVWKVADSENILIIVKDGRCRIQTDGVKVYELHKGDVFFIPAEQIYRRTPFGMELCTLMYIHFSLCSQAQPMTAGEMVKAAGSVKAFLEADVFNAKSEFFRSETLFLSAKTTPEKFEAISEITRQMEHARENPDVVTPIYANVKLAEIFALLSSSVISSISANVALNTDKPAPKNLKKACAYISLHYKENISLKTLAAHCGVSKQQLIRYFKAGFGVTPIAYITDFKLSKAKEMLYKYPELTIKEAAAEIGFENQHYFSRVFSRECGETPSEYKFRTEHYGENNAKKEK